MPSPVTPRIVIIGGGFAGAACALHLLNDYPALTADLAVIEPREVLGAGLAYSSPALEHRINVAAARMSVFPEDLGHFDRWVREQGEPERDPDSLLPDGRLYPSRAVYSRYVSAMLLAARRAAPGVAFRHIRDVAASVRAEGGGFAVLLAGGEVAKADMLVLAVSHSKPDIPATLRGCAGLIADPWDVAALRAVRADARVLIVGTGLTACDVVASLLAQGHAGAITALSRHGLLPRPRTMLPVEAEGDFSNHPETRASSLLRRIRKVVARAADEGRPWENIIDALRQQAGTVWGSLDWTERRRALRHLRTVWDVHRFQCAPQIDSILRAAQQRGALSVKAAYLLSAEETGSGVAVHIRPRGSAPGSIEKLTVDVVINCTGPGHRSVTATHPVLRGLAAAGGLQPDPAALGILVDWRSRVIREDGTAWPNLFVAGPLARGTFGELMGLPQVNTQPRAVAAELAGLVAAS